VDDVFAGEMAGYLEKYRMAGHDLQVEGPQYVSLEITMRVYLKDDYLPWDVKEALLKSSAIAHFLMAAAAFFIPIISASESRFTSAAFTRQQGQWRG